MWPFKKKSPFRKSSECDIPPNVQILFEAIENSGNYVLAVRTGFHHVTLSDPRLNGLQIWIYPESEWCTLSDFIKYSLR